MSFKKGGLRKAFGKEIIKNRNKTARGKIKD